jgi:aldehyde:ferredoxin oxidoreductase
VVQLQPEFTNKNEIKSEPLDSSVVKEYIGGRGLGIYYLLKDLDPNCNPLAKIRRVK